MINKDVSRIKLVEMREMRTWRKDNEKERIEKKGKNRKKIAS